MSSKPLLQSKFRDIDPEIAANIIQEKKPIKISSIIGFFVYCLGLSTYFRISVSVE